MNEAGAADRKPATPLSTGSCPTCRSSLTTPICRPGVLPDCVLVLRVPLPTRRPERAAERLGNTNPDHRIRPGSGAARSSVRENRESTPGRIRRSTRPWGSAGWKLRGEYEPAPQEKKRAPGLPRSCLFRRQVWIASAWSSLGCTVTHAPERGPWKRARIRVAIPGPLPLPRPPAMNKHPMGRATAVPQPTGTGRLSRSITKPLAGRDLPTSCQGLSVAEPSSEQPPRAERSS